MNKNRTCAEKQVSKGTTIDKYVNSPSVKINILQEKFKQYWKTFCSIGFGA